MTCDIDTFVGHRIIVGKIVVLIVVFLLSLDSNQSEWFKCKSTKITKSELQRTSISKQDQDTKELNFDSKRDTLYDPEEDFFGYFSWQQKKNSRYLRG